MAVENKPLSNNSKTKKRKFLPHGKPVKKGLYPLRPGVQGFFITCDGGRERQATSEALNLLESFYDELIHGSDSTFQCKKTLSKPVNKIIKFKDSDSSEEDEPIANVTEAQDHNQVEVIAPENGSANEKRLRLDKDGTAGFAMSQDKPIDELIEDELSELGDRSKRHFVSLDAGCNGCIFVQMHKRLGDPTPAAIALHLINTVASTKKQMSRFILRVMPAEITCYASADEISKSIKPLIEHYFPLDASSPIKFAVLYEARSNTGIERMSIINAVAKSVPQPHKVDLNNPDKTIIVQIAKTICMIGVVEKYKKLAKFNLRQLISHQQQSLD